MTPLAFLDTETTGLRVENGHRIIEIGIVTHDWEPAYPGSRVGRTVIDTHVTRVNPIEPDGTQHPIEAGAQAVHGITLDMLRGEPRFASVVDWLLKHVRGRSVVIHNAPFDVGFLDAELARVGCGPFAIWCRGVICSRERSKRTWPDQSASLNALCDRLGVNRAARDHAHGALLDAELLAECWMRWPVRQEETAHA